MNKQNLKILAITMLMNICLFGAGEITAQSNVNGKPNPTPTPTQQTEEAEAKVFFDSGVANYNKKNYDATIRDFTKAIELNPQDAVAYNWRGFTFAEDGDHDAAIKDYTKAIEIDPQYPIAYINRAYAYAAKEDYDSAIRDYTKAMEFNLKVYLVGLYQSRAAAYESTGRKDLAEADRKKAAELSKGN